MKAKKILVPLITGLMLVLLTGLATADTAKFVAVGDDGAVRWSDDGKTWTTSGTAGSITLDGVAYSPDLGLFAAVGEGGAVRWSEDGKTWTDTGTAGTTRLNSVAWSSELGLFAAVGFDGAVRWSEDGKTWTTSGTAGNQAWHGVAYSPDLGLFAAVGAGGRVVWSDDGKTWSDVGFASIDVLHDLAWSPELGLFAAVGLDSSSGSFIGVRLSEDRGDYDYGETWFPSDNSAGTTRLRGIAWSPELGLFAAVGEGGAVRWSEDGKTWTDTGTAGTTRLNSVAWSSELGLFAAVGFDGAVRWSEDGKTWTTSGTAGSTNLQGIAAFYEEPVLGCTDPEALNYDPSATIDDGSCEYEEPPEPVFGCTDPEALNYDPSATEDDGSCEYPTSQYYLYIQESNMFSKVDNYNVTQWSKNLTVRHKYVDEYLGDVYLITQDHDLFKFDFFGEEQWNVSVPNNSRTMKYYDEQLFIAFDNEVMIRNAATGVLDETYNVNVTLSGAITFDDMAETILYSPISRTIYRFDYTTNETLWTFFSSISHDFTMSEIVVDGDYFYYGGYGNVVRKLYMENASIIWQWYSGHSFRRVTSVFYDKHTGEVYAGWFREAGLTCGADECEMRVAKLGVGEDRQGFFGTMDWMFTGFETLLWSEYSGLHVTNVLIDEGGTTHAFSRSHGAEINESGGLISLNLDRRVLHADGGLIPIMNLEIENSTYPGQGRIIATTGLNDFQNSTLEYNLYVNGSLQETGNDIDVYLDLPAGTYLIEYNTTGGEFYAKRNIKKILEIQKGNMAGSITNNRSWTFTYDGTPALISYDATNPGANDVTIELWRNNTLIGLNDEIIVPGTYSYVLNSTEGQNYTATLIDEQTLTVLKAEPQLFLQATGATYPDNVTIIATAENLIGSGDLEYNLYLNNDLIGTGDDLNISMHLGGGTHNLTYNTSGGENYTNIQVTASVVVARAAPELALNASPGWTAMEGNINLTGLGCPENLNCALYRNQDLITNPFTGTFSPGIYTITYNTTGDQNYTGASVQETLVVESATGGQLPGGGGAQTTVAREEPVIDLTQPREERTSIFTTTHVIIIFASLAVIGYYVFGFSKK